MTVVKSRKSILTNTASGGRVLSFLKDGRPLSEQHKPDPDRKLFKEQLRSEQEQDAIRQEFNINKALELQVKGKGEATLAWRKAIQKDFDAVCDGIKEYKQSRDLRRGPKTITYKAFEEGRLDNLAHIIIQTTLKGVWTGDYDHEYISRANLAFKIGKNIEREARYASGKGTDWVDWSGAEQARCGGECLDEIMIKKTNLIEYCELPTKNPEYNAMWGVKPTDYLVKHIEHYNLIFKPLYSPMVCEPDWWEGQYGGGYLNKERKIPIIKHAHPEQLERMTPKRMPLVFKALNGIQAVPWKINKKMLCVVQTLWDKSEPKIRKLQELQKQKKQEEKSKKLNRTELEVLDKKIEVLDKKITDLKCEIGPLSGLFASEDEKVNIPQVELYLSEANRYAKKERFWLPANFDFRGRVYYLPFLKPQGPDMVRALFDFADGAHVLTTSKFNSYGRMLYGGRTSYDGRLKWSSKNINNIREAAGRPLDNEWWRGAEHKWQFLKWCLEGAFRSSVDVSSFRKDDDIFSVSNMPIYVDGSCNAIQHLAALLKDERLAKSVNMCPLDELQDIYSNIAKNLHSRLKELSEKNGEDAEFAKEWLRLEIGRSDIKKTVMTTPYGRTEYMNKEDIYEKFRDRLRIKEKKKAATWINGILWEVIAKEMPQNKLLMSWLTEIAKQFNKSKKHIEWAVPSGFIVRQRYYKYNSKLVKLPHKKKIRVFRFRVRTDDIGETKSKQAIVANFVHSLDASSLIMTVCQLLDAGRKNFGVIHDCFGTSAGDMECLERCVRDGFVQTHHGDLLQLYHNSFYGVLKFTAGGKDLPDPPPTGTFDVNTVYKAIYLFS